VSGSQQSTSPVVIGNSLPSLRGDDRYVVKYDFTAIKVNLKDAFKG
jgi:hypothetical protein